MPELNQVEVIKWELDKLEQLRAYKEHWLNEKQVRINELMTPEILEQIKDIEAEYDITDLDRSISSQESIVKDYVLLYGETVKGNKLSAIYVKGGYTANIDKLLGMSVALPQVMTCLSTKKPYVTIKSSNVVSIEVKND